ncbi:MAG: hypothetical protein Q9202_005429 [Teloschistes flavicans]
MALVDYSDSEGSAGEDGATKEGHSDGFQSNLSKRQRSLERKQQPTLPPLPDSFHDLYASNARASKNDDPSLHGGRQRQIPHIEGQWPTHVYIEWRPSRSESEILSSMLEKAKASLLPNVRLESLLKSDLEADLPLHISLSRTLMLATHERQTFTDALEAAIGTSGVKPFAVTLNKLHWVPNYENNRWFLVLQAIKPAGNGLTKLLVASNTVAKRFGQSSLYTPQNQPSKPLTTGGKLAVDRFNGAMRAAPRCSEAHDPNNPLATGEDLSDHFHVSIGWTLERPHETSASSILNENQLERLELGVHGIKAKIGNNTAAHECVCDDALIHLKSYKYSSVDKSLISRYILKHYWNGFVELLPLWLAPNMVTLLGFFCILANVVLLEIFVPDLVGPAPSWLYYSFALGLWMYSTMDNVDGKQARRTGQSSGLGELFDHGIDSLNCTLASLCETAAMGLGSSPKGVFTALIPCLPMFFSTWETYHTHTLYLGYFNGPTEGLIIACSMMILSGYHGPQIWTQPITDWIDRPEIFGSASVVDLWFPVIFGTFLFIHLPACVINVIRARRAKGLPVAPVFTEWVPIIIFSGSCAAWLYSPYSTLMQENRLVLFCLTMSFVFGRMTTKIILAHLTRQPFPLWTVLLAPLLGGAVIGNLPLLGFSAVTPSVELWYLRAYFVFAVVVYFRWAVLVINSICNYLGINCLTITPTPAPNQEIDGKTHRR